MKLNKKAVSPLIAAVLLIVVTVGIGGVVVSMIRGYVTENKATMQSKVDEMACTRDVTIDVTKIDGEPQICINNTGSYIDVVMENNGAAVDDFQLVVFGDSGLARNDSSGYSMPTGSTQQLKLSFSSSGVGNVLQVKIVPKLKKPGNAGYFFCNEVAITDEGIASC